MFWKKIFDSFYSKRKNQQIEVPKNHSPLRSLMAAAGNNPNYQPLNGFEDAKKHDDAVVIFEGDFGGQIYLTIPLRLVNCSEKQLKELLLAVDEWGWAEPEGASLFYEKKEKGDMVSGGMGGGMVTDSLWVHAELREWKIDGDIAAVMEGSAGSLRRPPHDRS